MELIKCPECGLEMKNLKMHLFYKHNLNIDKFREKYPEFGKTQIVVKHEKKQCPICLDSKLYAPNALGTHMSYIHNNIERGNPENKIKAEKRRETKEGYICPICNKKYRNLSQHIEITHKIKWEDFIISYNWEFDKAYFSDSHKNNLSVNKQYFYDNTSRGQECKIEQSIRSSGENNPACKLEVRQKISDSRKKNGCTMTDQGKENVSYSSALKMQTQEGGYGLFLRFIYNDKIYFCRSFEEFKIIYTLLINDIEFISNKTIIKYQINGKFKNYVPDLIINDTYIEIKRESFEGIQNQYNKEKYINIKSLLNSLNKNFNIFNYELFCKYLELQSHVNEYFYIELHTLFKNNKLERVVQSIRNNAKPNMVIKICKEYKEYPEIFKIKYIGK
jgi:predicted transcriptional regulator